MLGSRATSLAGEYYESFFVNSKNYTQQPAKTSAWISGPDHPMYRPTRRRRFRLPADC